MNKIICLLQGHIRPSARVVKVVEILTGKPHTPRCMRCSCVLKGK